MFYKNCLLCSVALLISAFVLCNSVSIKVAAQGSFEQTPQQGTRSRRTTESDPQNPTPRDSAATTASATLQPESSIDDDGDVVRVETDLTNVLFTAMDKNRRFVRTIRQEDVRVLEDNVPQDIFTFQKQVDLPLSLAIVIDTSASQQNTLPEEKTAARQFIDAVVRPDKDEVAVLSFTGEVELKQNLTGSVARARRAVDDVRFVAPSGYIGNGQIATGTPPISGTNQSLAGSTAIWDAVWLTSKEVLAEASDKTRRAIILLTDGVNTSGQMKMSQAIDQAIKDEVTVYSIGIGDSFQYDGVDEGSVRKISERTGGRAYFPKNESDLRVAFEQIQQELREQYLIAYSPKNRARDGAYRQVRLEFVSPELRKEKLRLTYRQGYFAKSASSATATPSGKKGS